MKSVKPEFWFRPFWGSDSPYKGLPFWGWPRLGHTPWGRPPVAKASGSDAVTPKPKSLIWSPMPCIPGKAVREKSQGMSSVRKAFRFSYHWITLDKIVWNYVQLKNIKNQLIVTYLTQYMTLFLKKFAAPRSPDQLTSPHLSMWTSKYLDLGGMKGIPNSTCWVHPK